MSRSLLLSIIFLKLLNLGSQTILYDQKLYYTAKVWGFLKYHHPEVSQCKVNWDSIISHRLIFIKNSNTVDEFNNELDSLIISAGSYTKPGGNFSDTIAFQFKRNRDFNWFKDSTIRIDIKNKLDTVLKDYRPQYSCWVNENDYMGNYKGYLVFPHDSMMYGSNSKDKFPDEETRMLILFKYWNIMKYFNPNNYILDISPDSILKISIPLFLESKNYIDLHFSLKKTNHYFSDAHVEGLTTNPFVAPPNYYYSPKIKLVYSENKYIVAESNIPQIIKGNTLTHINDINIQSLEDSLKPYISYGNQNVLNRFYCNYLLNGLPNSIVKITHIDSNGATLNTSLPRNTYVYDTWFQNYFPNAEMKFVKWKQLACNVGYVNLGNLLPGEVSTMYSELINTKALIFDLRKYPQNTGLQIANLLYPDRRPISILLRPNIQLPGTFYFTTQYAGYDGNSLYYKGKIIIIVNEETQSQGEYTAMILKQFNNSVVIGSQTAGADGNITYFNLTRDLYSGFTSLGTYMPDSTETQRIGIPIDSVVNITVKGIRRGLDELFLKALQIAGCNSNTNDVDYNSDNVLVYPNPASDKINISAKDKAGVLNLISVNGVNLLSEYFQDSITIDVSNFPKGSYLHNSPKLTPYFQSKLTPVNTIDILGSKLMIRL